VWVCSAFNSRLDTAQAYRNEEEAGVAIRESGLAREDIFITTKFSGVDGLDIETSIKNSLKNVRPTYSHVFNLIPTSFLPAGRELHRLVSHPFSSTCYSRHSNRLV